VLNFSSRQFKESNGFSVGQNEIQLKMLPTYPGGITGITYLEEYY